MDLKFAYMPATYDETSSMEDATVVTVHSKDDPSVKLTIRLIMQGKVSDKCGQYVGVKGIFFKENTLKIEEKMIDFD